MRDEFIKTLCALAKENPRIMLITGDLGFAVLDEYRRFYPKQFINAGVAEQNMTLLATGMALEGHIVFTYSIGNFPTFRCLEMIRNDAAYHDANVKVVSVGGGFSYGPLGISHHATEDLAVMRSMPGVRVFSPTGLAETSAVTRAAANTSGTCFLRLDKDKGSDGPAGTSFQVGVPRPLQRGDDVAFLVTGGILSEVERAAEQLGTFGISSSIYSIHTLKPFTLEHDLTSLLAHRLVVTVEEHTIHGGLGGLILETFADHGTFPRRFLRIGLDGCFSSVVGSQAYLRRQYKMDSDSIVLRVRQLLS